MTKKMADSVVGEVTKQIFVPYGQETTVVQLDGTTLTARLEP